MDPLYNDTVGPLYNELRYNSKIHYNVNLVCTKTRISCVFFIDIPMLFFRKTYVVCIFNEAILTNAQKVRFIIENCSNVSIVDVVWGQIRENVLKNEYAKHVGYKQFVVFHQN